MRPPERLRGDPPRRSAPPLPHRRKGAGLAGLGDPDDWTSSGRERKPSDWFTGVRGELSTHQWSGNLFREIALPGKVEIRFRARFPAGKPNVQIGLLRDPQNGPMLETWDNHLVLTHRTRFAPSWSWARRRANSTFASSGPDLGAHSRV